MFDCNFWRAALNDRMTFFAFGINHETAPVAMREAYALDRDAKTAFYSQVNTSISAEFLLLSTCNRTEVYLYGSPEDAAILKREISSRSGQEWPEELSFHLEDEKAVFHVIQVASGLKSQVLGDSQILNQVKEAYSLSVEADRLGTVLHRLMHAAFRSAKRVLAQTTISSSAASVSALAVTAAREHLLEQTGKGLAGKTALLIGAGEIGLLALRSLKSQGVEQVWVTNRTEARSWSAARKTSAKVIPWERRYDAVWGADVVIVATGAREPVLNSGKMRVLESANAPVVLIDMGMPRNIDPEIGSMEGYTVLDLDALNGWVTKLEETRRAELPRATAICEESLEEFVSWVFHHQALQPAIRTLSSTFETIRKQEVDRYAQRLGDLDRYELDRITRSIMQKLLSIPIVRLKDVAEDGLSLAQRIDLLNSLFSRSGCEDGQLTGLKASGNSVPDFPAADEVHASPNLGKTTPSHCRD